MKLHAEAYNLIKKETSAHVFSGKFCKSFKKTSIYRTAVVAAFTLFAMGNYLQLCNSLKKDFTLEKDFTMIPRQLHNRICSRDKTMKQS